MVETLVAATQLTNNATEPNNDESGSCPFEGPEKLLEIWFLPAPDVNDAQQTTDANESSATRSGLRTVDRKIWEDMLDIVKCKVLSVVLGREMDAYLLRSVSTSQNPSVTCIASLFIWRLLIPNMILISVFFNIATIPSISHANELHDIRNLPYASESSFFVFPHKLILKTCGTTLNLLGLPRILAIARQHCGYDKVWRCFYSRKSFMFPERQVGPHREWRNEVEYLDALFDDGAAYTVGKVNGDHWLLYMTSPPEEEVREEEAEISQEEATSSPLSDALPQAFVGQDYTLELMMTKLAAPGRRPFLFLEEDVNTLISNSSTSAANLDGDALSKHKGALVSQHLGIDSIFPSSSTNLDSYAFEPCGYSANALVDGGNGTEEGYFTIHVTPEEGWSYASFECNVPSHPSRGGTKVGEEENKDKMPDLETLIQRVVNIFQPGHISLTLFVSNSTPPTPQTLPVPLADVQDAANTSQLHHHYNEEPTAVEIAQRAFRQALLPKGYKRTDKINYEFGGYDLAFATFQTVKK